MNTITVSGLIHRFEQRVHQFERHQLGELIGKEPHYPMVVLLLGEEAIAGFPYVASHLYQLWPSYSNELLFLGITKGANGAAYSELTLEEDEVRSNRISSDGIGDKVSALFGLRSHFQDRSRLIIYQIVDTTRFGSEEDFLSWVSVSQEVKRSFVDQSLDTLEQLIVMLNENIGERQRVAARIKNLLPELTGSMGLSTLLLSNRRSDHTILEDWESCYRVIANTIALTNNSDGQAAGGLFNKGVFTAAYACEEKPILKIGHVVVKKIIDRLSRESFGAVNMPMSDKQMAEKLGLNSERTLTLLDAYAEKYLLKMLPTPEQLELFPRNEFVEYDDLSLLTEKDFNALTMNSWDSFLRMIIRRTQETVARDNATKAEWKREYEEIITNSFSISELIWLRDHEDEVRKLLTSARQPSSDAQVMNAAKTRIKYMLSSSPEIMDIFVGTIRELGDAAVEFLNKWNKLVKSGLSVHAIRDANLTQFYNRRVQDFFDHNEARISESFRRINSMPALEEYLTEMIDDIIESDAVFSAPFEDELEERLQEEASPVNTKQYIRQKLICENVPIYYQAQFRFTSPISSCIMLKVGTPLYNNLISNLSNYTYYYDTGSGNSAEALYYYSVTADNLLTEVDKL